MMHPAHIELRVSNLPRSASFYAETVGLALRDEDGDERATLGAPEGGPPLLVLRRSDQPGPSRRRTAGLFHTAFRYQERARLAATLRQLLERRGPLSGASDHGVSEALYLDDLDGLGIELYHDRPRDEWPPPGEGERVGMYTRPLDIEDLLAANVSASEATSNGAPSVDVGHVHLKVADVEAAVRFWTEVVGMQLMTRYGEDAAFIADGGYHHHIGANTWMSLGAALEPRDRPGLDAIEIAVDDDSALADLRERLAAAGLLGSEQDGRLETRTPDGVRVTFAQAAPR
jgi:catechol 2,3-dioxygenase